MGALRGLLLLCRVNLSILPSMPPGFVKIFLACFQFCTLFFLYGIALYSFSMPPIYKASLGSMLKNALVLLFKYLPCTLLCLCIRPCHLPCPAGSQVGRSGSFYAMAAGFSTIAYIQSLILLHVYKKAGIIFYRNTKRTRQCASSFFSKDFLYAAFSFL